MTTPVLFFIHGMWSFSGVWDGIRATLEAEGFETYAAKLPGHEGEPGDLATISLQDYVAALEQQAHELGRPLIVIGHSMGGLLAQLLAVRISPERLILLSTAQSAAIFALPWSALKTTWPVMRQWGYWTRPTTMPSDAARFGIFNAVEPEETARSIAHLVPDSGRVMFQIAMPFLDPTKGATVDYARLTMPTLVVCGDEDRITVPAVSDATARKIIGPVTRKEMSGFGHWIIGERGGPIVAQYIAKFVNSD